MKPHRVFILTSLALAGSVGTTLGLWMVLGWWGLVPLPNFSTLLATHSQLQVYGFVGLYTLGVAMMVLPTFLNTTLQPAWLAYTSLALMLAGIGLNLSGPTLAGGLCQSLSTLAFLIVLRLTRKSAAPRKVESSPLTRGHAFYLSTGSLWLMVCPLLALKNSTLALETVLWGFAGLFIAGIGLRVHTSILGIRGIHAKLLLPSALLWNLALILRWTGPENAWVLALVGGVGLFLWALRPFRKASLPPAGGSWLRPFVRTSYFWLIVAVILTGAHAFGYPGLDGPIRHTLGVGFVITMMMGMGMRMIPAFETKRIPWAGGPWLIYGLVTVGTAIRLPAQATMDLDWLALAGTLQFLSILSFIGLMLATYMFGKIVCYEAPAPPTHIFQNQSPKGESNHATTTPGARIRSTARLAERLPS
ncbi:MAG: hypothetical protein WC314_16130 [Vulcanimicrobiota bacterium]